MKKPPRKAAETVQIARNTVAETPQADLSDQAIGSRPTTPPDSAPEGSEQAGARANEARYLADLLASGAEPGEEGPSSDAPSGPGKGSS